MGCGPGGCDQWAWGGRLGSEVDLRGLLPPARLRDRHKARRKQAWPSKAPREQQTAGKMGFSRSAHSRSTILTDPKKPLWTRPLTLVWGRLSDFCNKGTSSPIFAQLTPEVHLHGVVTGTRKHSSSVLETSDFKRERASAQ